MPEVTSEVLGSITVNTKYNATPGDFFAKEYEKTRIVLHYTAGSTADGAATTLLQQDGVCVPFIVDKDGTIYQLFDPKCWAFSLGVRSPDYPKGHFEWNSIAIEIVNEGALKKVGDEYFWWPKNYGQKYHGDVIEHPFRGFDYHAAMPGVQFQAVCNLVKYLCDAYGVPKVVCPKEKRGELDLAFCDTFKGIVSHTNFRYDKWDFPDEGVLDWDGLQACLDA